jgi:hypothetical protein
MVSPPIQCFFEDIDNKIARILIPGAGNAYEADYLLEAGFTNITIIDIAPKLVASLKEKYTANKEINILLGDFFEHSGQYDIIIEQTFFCAIEPSLRQTYVKKMHELLTEHGYIIGVLFDREFEGGPPYGGSKFEYEKLFNDYFELKIIETCHNSVKPRAGSELFVKLVKK